MAVLDEARLSGWRTAAAGGDVRAMRRLAGALRRADPWEAERWRLAALTAKATVPVEVAEAGARLGAHRVTVGWSGLTWLHRLLYGVVVGPLVFVLAWSAVADYAAGRPVLAALGRLTFPALCCVIAVAVFASRRRVWCYQRGFVVRRRRVATGFSFAEVSVRRNIARWPSAWRYTVSRPDGAQATFTHRDMPAIQAWMLAATLERAVTAEWLPGALATVRAGGRLRFGDLVADAVGLTGPYGTAPWRSIQDLDATWGPVRIRRGPKWSEWSFTPAVEIPNVFVLEALRSALTR